MEARAIAKGLRIPPRKARLVIDLVRGKDVVEADRICRNYNSEAARLTLKVLTSAVANAENNLSLDKTNLYKIILIGKRNFDINTREILKLISKENILKIKDFTELDYNLEEISKENTLRGIFVKEALEKLNQGKFSKKEIEKAIEIGLKAL